MSKPSCSSGTRRYRPPPKPSVNDSETEAAREVHLRIARVTGTQALSRAA